MCIYLVQGQGLVPVLGPKNKLRVYLVLVSKGQVFVFPGAGSRTSVYLVQGKDRCVSLVQVQEYKACLPVAGARTSVFTGSRAEDKQRAYLLQGQGALCLPCAKPRTSLFAWCKFRD